MHVVAAASTDEKRRFALQPTWLVGRNVTLQGFYLDRLTSHRPDAVRRAADELVELWRHGAVRPIVGATFPLGRAADAQPADRGAAESRHGRPRPVARARHRGIGLL